MQPSVIPTEAQFSSVTSHQHSTVN